MIKKNKRNPTDLLQLLYYDAMPKIWKGELTFSEIMVILETLAVKVPNESPYLLTGAERLARTLADDAWKRRETIFGAPRYLKSLAHLDAAKEDLTEGPN